jgi:anti-sigma B factor antagonist
MFATDRRENVVVVTAVDQLDARNAEPAKTFFQDLVARGDGRVVVDLSDLCFVDSSGLAVLVAALKAAREGGGDVRLCGLNHAVRSVLEATRLMRLFAIHPDVDAANASFT